MNRALLPALMLLGLGCSSETGTIGLLPSQAAAQLPPTCTDEQLDGNETDLDCGGDCEGCGVGKICEEPADCIAGTDCVGKRCR